jgi:transposase
VIEPRSGTRIWIAAGYTDLRRGFQGLTMLVETVLEQAPFSGHLFVFRGKRGDLIKVLWFDGDGLCLFRSAWSVAASSGRRRQAARLL